MDGLFIIDKPPGMTSFDVVRRMKRCAKTGKVGHAGTLDPDATGVLVVAVGRATRFLRYLVSDAKAYNFDFCLGTQTDTDDASGDVIASSTYDHIDRAAIEQLLPSFLGVISQVPPAFSAIHVDGKRAYALARAGEQVDIPARDVRVDALELRGFESGVARLSVRCGSGTYVRSLARDLGLVLGTHGHADHIRRTVSGEFSLAESASLEEIEENPEEHCRPTRTLVRHLPSLSVSMEDKARLGLGQYIVGAPGPLEELLVLMHEDAFLGVGRRVATSNGPMVKPERMW